MEDPSGTIVFSTVGRSQYGFDVFSVKLPSSLNDHHYSKEDFQEQRLTDGTSINFNGQFVDDNQTLVYVSERTGASRIFLNRLGHPTPLLQLPSATSSLFHDRPIITSGRLYFVSAHQTPNHSFTSWSAVYATATSTSTSSSLQIQDEKIVRLTPQGCVDYSPALSRSGQFIAVASYGSRPWAGEFHDLQTDIVVFPASHPSKRSLVCQQGGWPTWSGDSTIFFHRQADDGWWSIFRVDLPTNFELLPGGDGEQPYSHSFSPRRITPPGLHSFTPAALSDGTRIAVATRRRDSNFRHIEIFDLETGKFHPLTELLNRNFHHYNPFASPDSKFIGYHRFRGESAMGDSVIPYLTPVMSPVKGLRMLRLNGNFPAFSPSGDFIAFNHDFDSNSGLKIVKSDGSKRWTLLKGRTSFYNCWSPTEKNVIYTSIGPIFESPKATVQIARISFDPACLNRNDDVVDIPADIKILTREETGNNAFPACSPDGKFLVFRSGRSGHKNLYALDAVNGEFNGGGIRQLTEGPWIDTMPSWSPKGDLIAFSSNRHNPDNADAFSIYVVRPDGTGLRRVHAAESADVDRERLNHVCFSADGEWMLFAANLGGVTAEPVSLPNQFQPYGELYVARLDGSGLRRLTCSGYENGTPAWHPAAADDELELGPLNLGVDVGDTLNGQFDEPLWLHCDL